MILKILTNNFKKVPLFVMTFDLNKYKKHGAKNSCEIKLHPEITDEHIINTLNELIDHIRDTYDMDKLSR